MFISSLSSFSGRLEPEQALSLAKSCIASHPELNKIFQVAALKLRAMEAALSDSSICYSKITGEPKQATVMYTGEGRPISVSIPFGYTSSSEIDPDKAKELYAENLFSTALAQFNGWLKVSPASLKAARTYADIQLAVSCLPDRRELLTSVG
jgi:hypothetical protein